MNTSKKKSVKKTSVKKDSKKNTTKKTSGIKAPTAVGSSIVVDGNSVTVAAVDEDTKST